MRWGQGRAEIDRMLGDGELQRVPASREQANRLLAQARVHVASALQVCDTDPPGGYALVGWANTTFGPLTSTANGPG
jgi:hypothetical protein